jgi:hypothetical protein
MGAVSTADGPHVLQPTSVGSGYRRTAATLIIRKVAQLVSGSTVDTADGKAIRGSVETHLR